MSRNCNDECTICTVARATGPNLKCGTKEPQIILKKKSCQKLSVCGECFQFIGKGIAHKCNMSNKKRCLEIAILASNDATRETIASTVIKKKDSPKGKALLLHTRGNKLRVSPGTSDQKAKRTASPPTIGPEKMATIQSHLNLSEQVVF